jgi:3-oxoacyl-[acyl-carrier-protein] synthase-3
MIRSAVTGIGRALPKRVMANKDFEHIVDTSDEWIIQRTGIRQRYIAGDDETTASLGEEAARNALAAAGREPADIDLIILATSTPNNTFPATAVDIQNRLGIHHGAAFDVQAVCSGYIYALTTADLYIRGGMAPRSRHRRRNLLPPARLGGPHDLRAVRRRSGRGGARSLRGRRPDLRHRHSRRQAAVRRLSQGKALCGRRPVDDKNVGHLRMQGREVFKHAVGMITDVIEDSFAVAGITADDIDWFVPHQANRRIIEASAKKLGIAEEKVVITVDRHGNTSAASVPLALSVAVEDGRIKKGDLILLEAMGGGFTWGAVLLRW